jgi:hypothetical protein
MSRRTLTAATVDRYLRIVRWPADLVTALLPGTETGPGPIARVLVERVDASVRGTLAALLGDDSLRADAAHRDAAANERERALDLRREANRRKEQTEAELRERHKDAGRARERASTKAAQRRRAASTSQQRRVANATRAQRERAKVSEAQRAVVEQRIEQQEAAAEQPAVHERANAVRDAELAVQERDEAQRLGEAAARLKEQRTQE